MSTPNAQRLDVIIFGATGFTGAATAYEAVRHLAGLRWAIAGRNRAKLQQVLERIAQRLRQPLDHIETIVADVTDDESLRRMSQRARLVVNCAGPYRNYGEPVVRACLATGTHHVDVSGEPEFVERMQLLYDAEARRQGVYVVSTCGFDSIPADLGALFAERQFAPDGEVNSIETYLRSWIEGGYRGGAMVNYGTFESAVYGIGAQAQLRPLRQKLFAQRLPALEPRVRRHGALHRAPVVDGEWSLPFPGADRAVMERTQRFLWQSQQKRPAQIRTYVSFVSIWHVIVLALVGGVFMALAQFDAGRRLLLAHPKFFSLGVFSRDGPTEETQRNTRFTITFLARGWTKRALADGEQHRGAPDRTVVTRVSGSNPGYGATCVALLLSARTILEQGERLPGQGGVLSPGAAFAQTDLIERLHANGLTFEVIATETH